MDIEKNNNLSEQESNRKMQKNVNRADGVILLTMDKDGEIRLNLDITKIGIEDGLEFALNSIELLQEFVNETVEQAG